jgi:hypothetical protein
MDTLGHNCKSYERSEKGQRGFHSGSHTAGSDGAVHWMRNLARLLFCRHYHDDNPAPTSGKRRGKEMRRGREGKDGKISDLTMCSGKAFKMSQQPGMGVGGCKS